jgi:4-diphosphocytidyl-2-C-methyl-D-erythritol kinase
MQIKSPAKINLFLRILNRRSDGYHNIASLLQTIDLCDTLHISLSKQDNLTCSDAHLSTDSSNLILKAADLFRRKTNQNIHIDVHLDKRIPYEAGLGGGSSNAAATLWAMNELSGEIASLDELSLWSSEIGSDIPFFFSSGTAYCTGRGESIQEISLAQTNDILIVKPKMGLSTASVYKNLNLDLIEKSDPKLILETFLKGKPKFTNDLEMSAFSLFPSLSQFKNNLMKSGFKTVQMSGSGTAFFCLGEGKIPLDPELFLAKANFFNRQNNSWYL